MAREYISTEKFVKNWISSSSVEEVAQKLNVDVRYALLRSNKLREGGAKIRVLSCGYSPIRSGRKKIDFAAINCIVNDFNSGNRIDAVATGSVADSLNQAISYGTK